MNKTAKTDFSDWLVVSDVDGTLNTKLRTLPQRNYYAISRFVQELNGKFTLASGRNIESMRTHYDKLPIKSTPAILLNGAGIYDYQKEDFLSFHAIDEAGIELVRRASEKFPAIEIEICAAHNIYLLRPRIFSPVMSLVDKIKHETFDNFCDIPKESWGKVIFMGFPNQVSKVAQYLKSEGKACATFMSSSIVSFEMVAANASKGEAVLELADILGVPREHTAAIGDYFNDYEMLKKVALPAACAQAPKDMHKIAKYHACHCNKGAVADFIEYIENNCQ